MRYFLSLMFTLIMLSSNGQSTKWKSIRQKPINLSYKLPKGWYIGGYQTPTQCKCTGATLNTAFDGSVNMLIFASNEYNQDSLSKQKVWKQRFDSETVVFSDSIRTPDMRLLKEYSNWINDSNSAVFKYSCKRHKYSYIFYFWGEKQALLDREQLIDRIVKTVKPINNG